MALPSWVQVSKPTVEQVKKGAELIVVTFVAAFAWSWVHSPNPFTKDALWAAGAAGVAAVYALAKGVFTTK